MTEKNITLAAWAVEALYPDFFKYLKEQAHKILAEALDQTIEDDCFSSSIEFRMWGVFPFQAFWDVKSPELRSCEDICLIIDIPYEFADFEKLSIQKNGESLRQVYDNR